MMPKHFVVANLSVNVYFVLQYQLRTNKLPCRKEKYNKLLC